MKYISIFACMPYAKLDLTYLILVYFLEINGSSNTFVI